MSFSSFFKKTHPEHGTAITPHATNANAYNTIYVGVTGDVEVVHKGDALASPVVYKNAPAGSYLIGPFSYVLAANTTATNLIGQS